MDGIKIYYPVLEESTAPETQALWNYKFNTEAYNFKQLAALLMTLNDETVGRLVLVHDKGSNTALLYVRAYRDGLLHRADEVTSLLQQRLHSRLSKLFNETLDEKEQRDLRKPFSDWVKDVPMPKTWIKMEEVALHALNQVLEWDASPSLEVVDSTVIFRDTHLVGVENGILNYLTGEMLTKQEMSTSFVFNQYPWEFDRDIWENGGEHEGVDYFFPCSFIYPHAPEGLSEWQRKQWRAWRWIAAGFHQRMDKTAFAMFTKTDAGKSTMMEILDNTFARDVQRMSSSALQKGYGTNPTNPEILKMGVARYVYIEESRRCSPDAVREMSAAQTVSGREVYFPLVTVPVRAMMVFASNPDPRLDIIGLGNTSDAGDAMANRIVSLPLDQVPKEAQVSYTQFLLDKKFRQVFGHRFLKFVGLCARLGEPEPDEEIQAERKRHRDISKPIWLKDLLPEVAEEGEGKILLTSHEVYTALQLKALEEGMSVRGQFPTQRRVTEEFVKMLELTDDQLLKGNKQWVRVYDVEHRQVKRIKTKSIVIKGFKLTEDSEERISDSQSQRDLEGMNY